MFDVLFKSSALILCALGVVGLIAGSYIAGIGFLIGGAFIFKIL